MATIEPELRTTTYVLGPRRGAASRLTLRRWQLLKRAFDLCLAVVVLPFVAIALLVCAAAVAIDSPGPVLFRQQRTGKHGRRFAMFKFRTMVANAEELKGQLAHLNVLQPPDFKIPDDPRITRVGRVLRQTSLDELPQIFNILRGEMSFVGPRPTSFAATTYDLWHGERLDVLPGLTGLWQIDGRGTTEFDERLRLDIEYIRNWSFRLDLLLLLRTLTAVIQRRGAH